MNALRTIAIALLGTAAVMAAPSFSTNVGGIKLTGWTTTTNAETARLALGIASTNQTPWESDIDGNQRFLTNVNGIWLLATNGESYNSLATAANGSFAGAYLSLNTNANIYGDGGAVVGASVQNSEDVQVSSVSGGFASANIDGSSNILVSVQDAGVGGVYIAGITNMSLTVQRAIVIGTPPSNYTNTLHDVIAIVGSNGLATGMSATGFFGASISLGTNSLIVTNTADGTTFIESGTNVLAFKTNAVTTLVPLYGDGSGLTNVVAGFATNYAGVVMLTNAENIFGASYIDFPTNAAVPANPPPGTMRTYSLSDNGFVQLENITDLGIRNRLNQDVKRVFQNNEGAEIVKGQVVYIDSGTPGVTRVKLARANSITTMPAVALATAPVGIGAYGEFMVVGRMPEIKTDYGTWAEGDNIYVSADVAGAITNVAPAHPNFSQWIGIVDTVHSSQGVLTINVKDMQGTEDGTVSQTFVVGSGTNLIGNVGSALNAVGFTNGVVTAANGMTSLGDVTISGVGSDLAVGGTLAVIGTTMLSNQVIVAQQNANNGLVVSNGASSVTLTNGRIYTTGSIGSGSSVAAMTTYSLNTVTIASVAAANKELLLGPISYYTNLVLYPNSVAAANFSPVAIQLNKPVTCDLITATNGFYAGTVTNVMNGLDGYPTATTNVPIKISPVGLFGYIGFQGSNVLDIVTDGVYVNLSSNGVAYTRVLTNGFGCNLAGGELTNTVAGYYGISFGLSAYGSAGVNGKEFELEVFINGIPEEHLASHATAGNVNTFWQMNGGGIVYLAANSLVGLRMKEIGSTDDPSIHAAYLRIGAP